MAKAKFDIKTEATKTLHAGVGAADLAVETVKGYVVDAQKRFETVSKDAQKFVTANVETATGTYETLAKRGETVVRKLRGEAAQTVAPEGKVVRNPAPRKPAAKKAPAKKATAKKTTKKATAKTAS